MKLNVVVLFGGVSVEHEVSIISALQAMAAIDASQYNVIPVYQSKQSHFYSGELLSSIENYQKLDELLNKTPQVVFAKEKQKHYLVEIKGLRHKHIPIDLVIPVVHGKLVEDGTIQGFLESLGIPYAGSDVMASAIGQDKVFMKLAFEKANIPTVKWVSFTQSEYNSDSKECIKLVEKLKYPVILKPASLGSSVGISFVKDEETLLQALQTAFSFDSKVIIEKAVTNLREINCSILSDGKNVMASALEEVYMKDAILSYSDKYLGSSGKSKGMVSTSRDCPAKLDPKHTKEIQDLAIACFNALGCSGVARMDFLMDSQTNQIYANEINTIPGSLSFYLWEASGKSFTALMETLIQQAIRSHSQKEKRITSIDTNLLANFSYSSSKGKHSKL